MKALPVVLTALLTLSAVSALPASAVADTYVKTESHTESYYRGGMTFPAEDSMQEMWIGADRLATVTEGRRIVVDLDRQIFIFVNRTDSTYVVTPLPLDLATVFSEEEHARLELFKRQGKVEHGGDVKTFAEKPCTSYAVNDWMIYDESKLNERDIVMWVTADLPFEWVVVNGMLAEIERIGNFGDEYIASRRTLGGFPMTVEETTYTEGISIPTTRTVTEMEERDPPEGIYEAPAGFTKKELLTLQDLRS